MHIFALVAVIAAQAPSGKPIKLAAPGLSGLGVTEEVRNFYSEQLAQELALRGIKVTTPQDMQSVLGLERQKQLLSCNDQSSSCMAELANALGVDGIVQGSIGKLGKIFQLNVKVVSATDSSQLSVFSARSESEDGVLDQIQQAAKHIVPELQAKLRGGAQVASASGNESISTEAQAATAPSSSGFILGAQGSVEVLGKTVSPELIAGYHFSGLDLSARIRVGSPAVGIGLHAGYDFNLGPVTPFAGLRGDFYSGVDKLGVGAFVGARVPVIAGVGVLAEGSGEMFFGPSPFRSNGVVLALGVDWRP